MDLQAIQHRKQFYPVSAALQDYLVVQGRLVHLPLAYADLMRHEGLMPHHDADGRPSLWYSVLFGPAERDALFEKLVATYQLLIADGRPIEHLRVASIDLCPYGNSQPFRVKIVNQLNENHDYFYIKRTDANRVYGLELEHLLSPNRINFLVDGGTLVEEHIIGVPGDAFIAHPERYGGMRNEVRLCKEFVKFNERCFIRLLGDMHMHNFVVEVTPDFENTIYRLRAIDFDQQSYEGNRKVYLPQFHKENNPIIRLGMEMAVEARRQYQREERAVIRYRIQSQRHQLDELLAVMKTDTIAPDDNVRRLRDELAQHYDYPDFHRATHMGELLHISLDMLFSPTHGQVALP